MNHLVSIVVPVYKVSEYLERCVDSILAQDHKNIEVILVDDGSPDKCPVICDQYAKKDSRVKVIHKKNGGLSDARNAGIESAKGDYLAFIDGDDYVAGNFVSKLLDCATKNAADIAVCNYYKIWENSKIIVPSKIRSLVEFTNIEAMRDIFTVPSFCEVMTWNKLYKKELFTKKTIRFPVGKIHEDNFTTYKLFYFSDKVAYMNEPLYYYVQRDDSIMSRNFSRKSLDMIEAAQSAADWVEKYKLQLREEVLAYQLSIHINLLNTMVDKRVIHNDIWQDLTQWMSDHREDLLKNDYINIKQKLLIRLLKFGVLPYRLVRALYKQNK